MEHLAWDLLETKKDILAAEQVFAALANRARLRSTATSISPKDFEMIQAHKMVQALMTLFYSSSTPTNSSTSGTTIPIPSSPISSSSSSSTLTPDQSRSLANAVLEERIPSFVLLGCPETEEEISKALHRVQLFIHPDKGHVKTSDAFVKLSSRKEQCIEQMYEFLEYKEQEMKKKEAKQNSTSVLQGFTDAIRQHEVYPLDGSGVLLSPSSPTLSSSSPPGTPLRRKQQKQQVPFSSIPTGQNMFNLHNQQQHQENDFNNNNETMMMNSTKRRAAGGQFYTVPNHHREEEPCSPRSPHHRQNTKQDVTPLSPTSLFESSSGGVASGNHALPPLQSRTPQHVEKMMKKMNNNTNNTNSSPTSSPSFASPTRKPDPLERSSHRPPSAARNASLFARMNASKNSSSSSNKQAAAAPSPGRGSYSKLHEKNKKKQKDQEFESLLSQLRNQKHATGSNMTGRFNSFLNQMAKDHDSQMKEEERKFSCAPHLRRSSSLGEFGNDVEDENENSASSSSMAELTMKALLSKLKVENSNVKINCSISSSHHDSTEEEDRRLEETQKKNLQENTKIVIDGGREENTTASAERTSDDDTTSTTPSSTMPKNCRDFVLNKLGKVFQGHLSSLGIDENNQKQQEQKTTTTTTMMMMNEGDQNEEDGGSSYIKQAIGGRTIVTHLAGKRRESLSSHHIQMMIPSPPRQSTLSNTNHDDDESQQQQQQRLSMMNGRSSSRLSMNHQGVAVVPSSSTATTARNSNHKKTQPPKRRLFH